MIRIFEHPSGEGAGWLAETEGGRRIPWSGLQTGPLTLPRTELGELCHHLLGVALEEVESLAERVLVPAVEERARLPAVLLHSTTPDLKTFDGDLDALVNGRRGGDFTTYKEARSVYLGGPGDVAVGRTRAWRAAVDALGLEAIELEDADHYYLSHALLHLAASNGDRPPISLGRLIELVRRSPRRARLYAFELEMQIFLLWLARRAGVEELAVEANGPALSAAWNRKSVLHPAVERALELPETGDARELLLLEGRACELARELGIEVPRVPGYTLERRSSAEDFARQAIEAAELLCRRHGLARGCLKASESGDGARITPGLPLDDVPRLAELARRAWIHGDDYVLEAHVAYGRVHLSGQTLPTALSAHVRGGEVAPGATLQFMEGTSWKGNLLLDEASLEPFQVPIHHYHRLRRFVTDFRDAFHRRDTGLVLAGIDFALGTVGGHHGGPNGSEPILGVQDLNVSFTGAECLRAFLEKAHRHVGSETPSACGVTRIYRPTPEADHAAFLRTTRTFETEETYADTIAAIPNRWAMVGITGPTAPAALDKLSQLQAALESAGLIGAVS